jgi:hypothetical protein
MYIKVLYENLKKPLGKPRSIYENNTKLVIRKMCPNGMDLVQMNEGRDTCQAI